MTSTCGAAALESNAAGQRTIVVAAKVFADAPRPQDDPRRRSLEAREPPEEAARATDLSSRRGAGAKSSGSRADSPSSEACQVKSSQVKS